VPIEGTLRKLQRLVRLGQQPDGIPSRTRRLFDDMDKDMLALTEAENRLMIRAIKELQEDLRFEHLDLRDADKEVWRFLCEAVTNTTEDHVGSFVETHARQTRESMCFFSLEHLVIKERFDIGGVRLLPLDDLEVPAQFVSFPPPCAGIVAVRVIGTSNRRMKERAEAVARHALRLLRVGLREDRNITEEQLRFRLGNMYAFSDGGEGWGFPENGAIEATFNEQLRQLVQGQPLSALTMSPANNVEAHALTALDWFDRARRASDPLTRTLFDFFAIEALLGDRSEREKGLGITFRRTMLSVAVNGHFSNPEAMYFFYDEVRSGAVHGEAPLKLEDREFKMFDWSARQALNEYLTFAQELGVSRRSDLRIALETHPKAQELLDWLRGRDSRWDRYELVG
jgi:hypothetical protein